MPPMINQAPLPPSNKTGWPWTEISWPRPNVTPDGLSWLPRVSVVTPSYNQGQFIEATLRSVLLQGYPNLEFIVIDGGSTDESVDIIRQYEPWLTYWVSEPDRGQSHAINKGLNRGTGDIFTWLNSDDMLLPGALWRVAEAYRAAPDAAAWVGSCHLIQPDGRILKTVIPKGLERDRLADWFYDGFFFQPSCFFAASAWQKTGGVDESLYFAMDFDLWLRLSALGEFTPVADALSAAIIHENAKTQALIPEMHVETMVLQFKYGYQEIAAARFKRLLAEAAVPTPAGKKWTARLKRGWRKLTANKQKQPQYIQFVPVAPADRSRS